MIGHTIHAGYAAMGGSDKSHESQGGATLEQLRGRRRQLADRIQFLLAELESTEREFEDVNRELERRMGRLSR